MDVDLLVSAYSQGIFPWPHDGYPLLWFCPWERGVLKFEDLHVSRSLAKASRRVSWQATTDKAFEEVIRACSNVPRPGQNGTWITDDVRAAYEKLHRAGYAHSFEVWEGEELVGGIYGVYVKNVFSAESMFFRRSNASKWALWQLVIFLQNHGLEWIDVQMVTNVSESFGAKLIAQKDFFDLLRKSQQRPPIQW
jgi:leucyl/phenylalanyl-tRNA--protein transferase